MRGKKLLASLLAASMLILQAAPAAVQADAVAGVKVVTLGADLDEGQKDSIMQFFGVEAGDVEIITITNQDERDTLGLLLPMEQIGTHTYSCAMVSPTRRGGIQVKTANMNYVTSNMIASTLSTSGVVNCDVLTAAPFEVSGTGALTGTMMAFETASGQQLDQAKKELANEELVTTEDLADSVGQEEATLVVNDIKIHIIRDQIKEEDEVRGVVDDVVDTATDAMQKRESVNGQAAGTISDGQRESLYSFGVKVSRQDYNYDDMKVTLQRVTENVTESTGLEDPIIETFEDLSEESQLADDSILRDTDDAALGEDSNVNSTTKYAVKQEGTETVRLTPGAVIEDSRLLYDTNVIYDGSYLYDMEGRKLSETSYLDADAQSYSYITVRTEAGMGLCDIDGRELVAPQYTMIYPVNAFWAAGLMLEEAADTDYDIDYYGSYYKLNQADIYFIEDAVALKVAEYAGNSLEDLNAHEKFLSVKERDGSITMYDSAFNVAAAGLSELYDTAGVPGASDGGYVIERVNGQAVVKDASGNTVVEPGYQSVYNIRDGVLLVYNGEHYGLVGIDGTEILPALYGGININYYGPEKNGESYSYGAGGYYAVSDDAGKLCFVIEGGVTTAETGAKADAVSVYGASAVYQDAAGGYHILAADGVQTALPQEYTSCSALDHANGMLYQCHDEEYNSYLLDWHGELIRDDDKSYRMSGDGRYLTVSDYETLQVYSVSFAAPQAPVKQTAESAAEEVPAEESSSENAPVEKTATQAAPSVNLTKIAEVEDAYYIYSSSNLQLSEQNGRNYALADEEGRPLTGYDFDYSSIDGYYGMVRLRDNDGYYMLNKAGEHLTDTGYDYIDVESENWIFAYKAEEADESSYDIEDYYNNRYLSVVQLDVYHVEDGASVLIGSLNHDQAALVTPYDNRRFGAEGRDGRWTAYDQNFNVLISDQEDSYEADRASGYQEFTDNGHEGIKDAEGNIVLPALYQSVNSYDFDGKYVAVYDGAHYGLMNLDGELVLPVEYDQVLRAYESNNYVGGYSGYEIFGYFTAVKDGKLCYLREGGEVTFETAYDESVLNKYGAASCFQNFDGTYTLLAADGVETPLAYEDLSEVSRSGGVLWTTRDADYNSTLLDWHGNVLLDTYNWVYLSYDRQYVFAEKDGVTEIYRVSLDGSAAPAAESDAAVAKETLSAAEEVPAAEETSEEEAAPAEDRPEERPAAEEGSADTSKAKTYVDSALALIEADYETNAATIAMLLGSAVSELEAAGEASGATLLSSAASLIETGAGTAENVKSVITSAYSLLWQ